MSNQPTELRHPVIPSSPRRAVLLSSRLLGSCLLLGLLAADLAPGAFAAEDEAPVERLEGPIPDEVDALRDTRERFRNRMEEFERETVAFVNFREAEERNKLSGGYDTLLANLEEMEAGHRALAIERFEDFLEKYPSQQYSSHVRFRLAELYFEVRTEQWLKASEAYYAEVDAAEDDLDRLAELEERGEPKLDLTEVISLYQQIVDDNRDLPMSEQYEYLDGAYYMLGFSYYQESSAQRDEARAADIYRELVQVRPDSELSDAAHLFLGNFLFDDNNYEESIAEYTVVYDKGEEGPYYVDAMYQLAWSYYKLSMYDHALSLFTKLLDHSLVLERESGKASDYEPDSVKFMAHSFADMSDADPGQSALQVASRYFARSQPRPFEWDVFVQLGEVLTQYGRTDEAIEVYERLQDDPRWVQRPENPEFQMRIVNILGTGLFADPAAAGAARLEMTQRYNQGGEWWNANRSNPDALATARGFIESSLLDVAIEYRVRAQNSGEPKDFALAAEKYKEYLDKFPISDDYYKQQWYLADSLYRAKRFVDAEKEFGSLIRSMEYHEFGDGAVYSLMDTRLQISMDTVGPPDKRPDSAEVERSYMSADGVEVKVYQLAEPMERFVQASDAVLAHTFATEPVEGLPDYAKAVEERRPKIMYIAAQMLFQHNHFDNARPRFEAIIEQYPRTNEASYSAGLLVDSYLAVGDLEQVRDLTRRFATMALGESDIPDPKFQSTLEGTSFKICKAAADAGDRLNAADCFMRFLGEFPESEHKEFALYNAAHYYDEVGRADKAGQLFEDFVAKYPQHEWSRALYFRIAATYESTFELEKAIHYYELLVERFPDYVDAANAQYNASFLKIGLGDHLGAAKGFELYALHPLFDQPDKEEIHFKAGEQYEIASPGEAVAFYKMYLRTYGMENPDNGFRAMRRLAEMYRSYNNQGAYERQMAQILKRYDELVANGVELGPDARHTAAEAAWPEVEQAYEDLVRDKLTRNEDRDAALLNDTKPAQLAEFKKLTDDFVTHYNDFEYATAALYLQGKSIFYYADLGLAVEPPRGLTEEEQWAYLDILEEQFFPKFYAVQDRGIAHMKSLIDLAKKQKKHSEWVDKAYEALNEVRPADFPAVKPEILGAVDSAAPPALEPLRIPENGGAE